MTLTFRASKRERYVTAIKHMWNHPERYKVIVRGKDYGACIQDKRYGCGWYIEYQLV